MLRRRSPRLGAILALSIAVVAVSCPSRPTSVIYDLAARATIAELSSPREIVLFGTPAAEPHLYDGFFREKTLAGREGFVWAREDCHLSFTWPQVTERAALLDIEPYRGVKKQIARVFLNGHDVGSIDLDTRRRQRVELPASAQRSGENLLKLVFATTASPKGIEAGSEDDRHLAAALYSVMIGGADDPALVDLLGRDAPRPLAASVDAGVPALTQVGTSSVRYAVWLPSSGELRFTPDLFPAARAHGGSAAFRVTIEDVAGNERELWSGVVSARDRKAPAEITVPVRSSRADGLARLGLHVSGPSGDRFAWGVWKAPRVLGDRALDLLTPPPFTDEERRRGTAIRDGLGAPNVVFIILDAGRAQQFGCYGYSRPTTPNIDAIAREGVLFENAFTPAVYTLAAMSSVWTSQYPDRHHNAASFGARLGKDQLTLSELLSAQGVHTAGFVANSMAGTIKGLDRGFGEFHEIFKDVGSSADSFRHVLPAWLKANRDRRFFAYVHFREPHFPYDPEPPFDTKFGPDGPIPKALRRDQDFLRSINLGTRPFTKEEREHLVRLYDGNLAFADQEVGKLRDALQAEGLWDQTVVILAADHGEALFEHGYVGHNVQVYEESIHIPLLVRFPTGKGPAGQRVTGLVDLLDIAPTIADVFGVLGQGGSSTSFQGRSLFPIVAGAPGKAAILSRTLWDRPWYALRSGQYKFHRHSGTGEELLFDLRRDPRETTNLRDQEPLRAAYYRETLHAMTAKLAERNVAVDLPAGIAKGDCENMKAMGYLPSNFPCPED